MGSSTPESSSDSLVNYVLGGANSTPVTADMKAGKKTKRTDSTSTTASEAEFLEHGMQGSLRKRLVHRQSSVVTYERMDENTGQFEIICQF